MPAPTDLRPSFRRATPCEFGRRAQWAFINAGSRVMAEVEQHVAAILICSPMAAEPNPHVPGMDELMVPLMPLFKQAAGTF